MSELTTDQCHLLREIEKAAHWALYYWDNRDAALDCIRKIKPNHDELIKQLFNDETSHEN